MKKIYIILIVLSIISLALGLGLGLGLKKKDNGNSSKSTQATPTPPQSSLQQKINYEEDSDKKVMPISNPMKNIFGNDLSSCRQHSDTDSGGSWNLVTGQCDEIGGGVHQICVNMNTKARDFSLQTGQSDWSKSREGKNHCVCLGAYALHSAKDLDTLDLKCSAVPQRALSAEYIGKWSTWNNNEKSGQIRQGVRRLVETCREQASNEDERHHLEKLACRLTHDLKDSDQKFGADIEAMLDDLDCPSSIPETDEIINSPPNIDLKVGRLADQYQTIFAKSKNRNAAGYLWAAFILDRSEHFEPEEIRSLFSEYCPVSGSPVRPMRKPFAYSQEGTKLKATDRSDGEKGLSVHHCCWPCICDLQDCASVSKVQVPVRGGYTVEFDMLVIDNPCEGREDGSFVQEAPAVMCKNGKLEGARYTHDGKPIIGMLQSSNHTESAPGPISEMCSKRAENNYRNGMGNIFRKVCGL